MVEIGRLMLAALGTVLPVACGDGGAGSGAWSRRDLAPFATLSPIPAPPTSVSNEHAEDERAARLGRELFFDGRLSENGEVSCASCHDPERAFSDGRPTAVGLSETDRNTPTILGAAHAAFFNWDGRKDSLWSQALGPIEDPREMGSHRVRVARLVRDAYRASYEPVFGPLPDWFDDDRLAEGGAPEAWWGAASEERRDDVNRVFANVGKAIEAFERGLQPGRSAFDAYCEALAAGLPTDGLLSEEARRGLRAFLDSGCLHCHNGPLFTDHAFHRLGLPEERAPSAPSGRAAGVETLLADPFRSDGRYGHGATPDLEFLGGDADGLEGAFKTPSLRNVAVTAPYGHAGQFATLQEVLEFYRTRPDEVGEDGLDPVLSELEVDFDLPSMVAFLESLTDADVIALADPTETAPR